MPTDPAPPYAEVIGDPVAHSRSPLIHKCWLERLGISADYFRTRVEPDTLGRFLRDRRSDGNWRGCSVTIPHKEAVLAHVDELDSSAAAIGAVNCVVPRPTGLVGYNTDGDGIAASLSGTPVHGERIAIIGGGGAARAAIAYLAEQGAGEVILLVRDPAKAKPLRGLFSSVQIAALGAAPALLPSASAIINASPLGMSGCPPMPEELIGAIRRAGAATLFDMVYDPVETAFLSAGTGKRVDGLTMLVGQAAKAFELFFGIPAPAPDSKLRDVLAAGG